MSYRFPVHRIQELVGQTKCLVAGENAHPEKKGEHGAGFAVNLELTDGPFCDLRWIGKAGRMTDPGTYDSSLLLEQQRMRGVGYCAVPRQNFRAKLRIPAGWHQNICDPNRPTDHPDWNRHEPLPEFEPTDFDDFSRKTARLWHIDLDWEERLL